MIKRISVQLDWSKIKLLDTIQQRCGLLPIAGDRE